MSPAPVLPRLLANIVKGLLFACALNATGQPLSLNAQREAFQAADAALRRGEPVALAPLQDYPLYPYLLYRDLQQRLNQYPVPAVNAFLKDYAATPLAGRLRNAWLQQLAEGGRWEDYLRYYQPDNDVTRDCWRRQALLYNGRQEQALKDLEAVWLRGESLPQACDPVFKRWQDQGGGTRERVWRRFGLALDNGQRNLARHLQTLLPEPDQATARLWLAVDDNPRLILEEGRFAPDQPLTPLIILHGLNRWSNVDALSTAAALDTIKGRYALPQDRLGPLARQLALFIASRGHPTALARLTAVPAEAVDSQVREWRVRIHLQNRDWPGVLTWLNRLTPAEQQEPRWRYWRARALDATGRPGEAAGIYQRLAGERDYHGFLAADRLGVPYGLRPLPLAVPEQQTTALFNRLAGLQRARELYILGRQWEARVEWGSATQPLSEQDLRAAARLAQEWGWDHQAIATLARAGHQDDLELRFPLPYAAVVRVNADESGVDPAWIYAIMRQESLFQIDARSPAGALGLMQIMPATGARIASDLQQPAPDQYGLLATDTNIRYGVYYLRQALDGLQGNPLLATAAYNAGPSRVREWLPGEGAIEADLWAETIPYLETRKYVQRVMEYAAIYAWRLGRDQRALSAWMRPITASPVADNGRRQHATPVLADDSKSG